MKNLIAAGALSLVATTAVAQEYATITYVEPRYVTETQNRPYNHATWLMCQSTVM